MDLVVRAPREIQAASEPYDEYIDLRGYQRAEQSAVQTLSELSGAESAATVWLAQQLQKGAEVIGNAVVDAAGRVIGKLVKGAAGKVVNILETAPTMTKKRTNAPVSKVTPKKSPGGLKTGPMPVFSQPRALAAPVNISRRINVKTKPQLSTGQRGLVITHREMIGQIISAGTTLAFNTDSFVINPGKYATFPWLSNIAGNFDKYVMRRLRFYTISNQSTAVAGRVGLGYDVDSTDPEPADRNEFFSLTYHAECAPWDTVVLDIPVDGRERFINSHTTTDSKLIDIGQLILMSDSIVATNTALSDVIVEYTVELIDPQQAIYSTQYIYGLNASVPTLDLLPTLGPQVVQLSGPGNTFVSTSSVLYLKALQGYYAIQVYSEDAGSGSPGTALAVNGGTGRSAGLVNSTTGRVALGVTKITSNDSFIRVTFVTVTVPNLEELSITVTRISAALYVKMIANAIYDGDMTTF